MSAQLQIIPKPLAKWSDEELADAYGERDWRLQQIDSLKEEFDLYRAELQRRHVEHPEDLPCRVKGKTYTIHLGTKREQREITDQKRAFAALRIAAGSLDGAVALLQIPLGVLDKFVNEAKQKGFIKKEQTGYRLVKAVRNG